MDKTAKILLPLCMNFDTAGYKVVLGRVDLASMCSTHALLVLLMALATNYLLTQPQAQNQSNVR